jgi:hypothetical protein
MSDRTLIRPDVDTARCVYTKRRVDEVVRERAQGRADDLERVARRIALIDLEVALLGQIRTRELAVELGRRGFDTSGLKPLPLLTESRRGRRQPDIDPVTLARQV